MIKLGICGVGGRMGRTILALALQDEAFSVAGIVEAAGHALVGKELHGMPVHGDLGDVVAQCDVVVDFTAPEAALKNAAATVSAKKAFVVGTTGLFGDQRDEFFKIVKPIPTVFSPNMSLSANVLFEMTEMLARLMPDYDVEIAEIHHNQKKDAPSGTAQRLADSVQHGRKKADLIYGRHGLVGARKENEVGIHALRGGDVVGDHMVYFFGRGERVELIHRVTSREAFAHGALVAARWVVGRPVGLYDMRDVLGLKK